MKRDSASMPCCVEAPSASTLKPKNFSLQPCRCELGPAEPVPAWTPELLTFTVAAPDSGAAVTATLYEEPAAAKQLFPPLAERPPPKPPDDSHGSRAPPRI